MRKAIQSSLKQRLCVRNSVYLRKCFIVNIYIVNINLIVNISLVFSSFCDLGLSCNQSKNSHIRTGFDVIENVRNLLCKPKIIPVLKHWHKQRKKKKKRQTTAQEDNLPPFCRGHKESLQDNRLQNRERWCKAISVCFVCPWSTYQRVITRQCWSDELQAVISLLRLHSASRSVSSLMLLSAPTTFTVNLAAVRTTEAVKHKHALAHHTC